MEPVIVASIILIGFLLVIFSVIWIDDERDRRERERLVRDYIKRCRAEEGTGDDWTYITGRHRNNE